MTEYSRYRRRETVWLANWTPGFDMVGVSISEADKENGSPKLGDKIAKNPANPKDRWLVAAAYFTENFEPCDDERERCGAVVGRETDGPCAKDAGGGRELMAWARLDDGFPEVR